MYLNTKIRTQIKSEIKNAPISGFSKSAIQNIAKF